jgi:hypothetical protein
MFVDIEKYTVLGIPLVNCNSLSLLVLKLIMDLIVTFVIIRLIFYPVYKSRDYVFTTMLMNISVFLICVLMGSIKFKIGFAFGLFAVFSILRYRTEQISIREMTYMFVVIIIAVLNALSDETISLAELIVANVVVMSSIYILEKNLLHDHLVGRLVIYEKIDLIKPENYDLLIKDLQERTGHHVIKADVVSINFLNDTAQIKILFNGSGKPSTKG